VSQPFTRQHHGARLRSEDFDLLVIGGGITGAGVALDAASRGLKVALVEMADFASGTSSKSSKLIHGGLRYLQQGDVRLVYEALHERRRLMRNAPHLVSVLPFMIPILTKDGLMPRRIARALGSSLWMYDLTGGWRIGTLHRRLRAKKALQHFPTMPAEKLASAYIYYDAQADDARLTLEVLQTASDKGAAVLNYATVVALTNDANGRVNGVRINTDGEEFAVRARSVVSATGVWIDDIHRMETNSESRTVKARCLANSWLAARSPAAEW
jgi:glycerol-3-phosphate dehydrogenase